MALSAHVDSAWREPDIGAKSSHHCGLYIDNGQEIRVQPPTADSLPCKGNPYNMIVHHAEPHWFEYPGKSPVLLERSPPFCQRLNIAHRIKTTDTAFWRTVELAGEEEGLFGSKAYAPEGELCERGVDVVSMIQADMLAYHAPGEPPHIGLPKSGLVMQHR